MTGADHERWCEGRHLEAGDDRGACVVDRTLPDGTSVRVAYAGGGCWILQHHPDGELPRLQPGPGRLFVDTDDPDRAVAALDPTVAAVVATLRQLASWGVARPDTDDDWYALAAAVEACCTADPDSLDALCCPMCEEVTCDADCPLDPVRTRP